MLWASACGLSALLIGPMPMVRADDGKQAAADIAFFESKVRPLLVRHCFECHGPTKHRSELRLDRKEFLSQGGASGEPTVVPKHPEKSYLLKAVRHVKGAPAMPPMKKLTDAEIADLTRWIERGAYYPAARDPASGGTGSDHWAFQPVVEPQLPATKRQDWGRTPVDAFILAELEGKGLCPAPAADRRTLIRRATFDLIGLPPTPEDVEAFVRDTSPDAFARVVDRLLASPHYGERWGRHWLDLARYADSNGMDENLVYANAWRYRDYVIRSFNVDKPYDRFIREQIAGDLLAGPDGSPPPLEGTGFLVVGPKMLAEDDPVKMEMDIIDEQIETIGRAFLGMTLGCARCHDHKNDPVTMADYYGLAGIFKSTRTMDNFRVVARWHERPIATREQEERYRAFQDRLAQLKKKIDALAQQARERAFDASYPVEVCKTLDELRPELARAAKDKMDLPEAMAVSDLPGTSLKIHLRGNHLTLGKEAARGVPKSIGPPSVLPADARQSGRLELADWIARPDHPLTGRVMVNHLWHWHFGAGLVRAPDNFGLLGERPTHPQLLDWLAVRFVKSGWSIKAMHRLILLSSAYQMSVAPDDAAARIDPDNRLLWRMNRRRLEAEAIRDSLLVVSGTLDPAMGGSLLEGENRGYVPGYPNANYEKYDFPRRSVYLPVLRSMLYDVFQAFDFADPSVGNGQRATTTVAPQALFMMNGKLVKEASRKLAERILAMPNESEPARIQALYTRLYGRPASDREMQDVQDYLGRLQERLQDRPEAERRLQAWQSLCRVLLSANEFIYID
jgi:hypothetical protein